MAQVLQRAFGLRAARCRDRHHVMRVVVAGVRFEGPRQVVEGRGFVGRIERDCRGVDPLVRSLRGLFARLELALAHLQVQARPFEQFSLVRVARDDVSQRLGGRREITPL